MTWLRAALKFLPLKVWLLVGACALMGGGGHVAFKLHQQRLRDDGKRELLAAQLQDRADSLAALLHVEQQRTARIDTVHQVQIKHFTKTVTRWKTDTVRLQILALPDSATVPVLQYRMLSSAMDSVVSTAGAALSAADSLTAQERREKLLWKGLADTWKRRAETQVPIVTMAPRRWQHRGEGAVVGLAVAAVAVLVTR